MPGRTEKRHISGGKREKKKRAPGRERTRDYGQTESFAGRYGETSIIQKYLEPEGDREKELEARKREIMAAKQAKEERRRKGQKEAAASRVSYVRKPFAKRSRMSILLAAAALALGGAGIYEGVVTQGQTALRSGAFGFLSMFLSLIAVWYGIISFWEDDKNYILAKLGIVLGVLLLIGWTAVIIIGLGG